MEMARRLDGARKAAAEAARVILEHYQAATSVISKRDGSPLTPADQAAHAVIMDILNATTADIPIASEEGGDVEGDVYWSVDPLDGTKEYVARTGAFVVSIALIDHGAPVLGVVHVPVSGDVYFAAHGLGAFKATPEGTSRIMATPYQGGRIRLLGSVRHGVSAVTALSDALAQKGAVIERMSLGSAWKFGKLAEGMADIYPRFGPTHTWDTAAGQCILEEAGGAVWVSGRHPLRYSHPRQLNPAFVAVADPHYAWPDLLMFPSHV